jgi:hypothetical protein
VEVKEGQRIRVSFETTVDRVSSEGGFNYVDPTGAYVYVKPGNDRLTIEEVVPENWPPKIGDIWTADGTEWFARETPNDYPYGLWFVPARKETGIDADELKAFNPVLVRRR